eukprot:scaffold29854_cov19-Prasinocladus_malaysianus.AAC.1
MFRWIQVLSPLAESEDARRQRTLVTIHATALSLAVTCRTAIDGDRRMPNLISRFADRLID